MAGDVAINPVALRALTPLVQTPSNGIAAAIPDTPAQTSASKRPLLNPSLHVDLALNLVVLQFEDSKGNVTNSIPSEKQLKAYREQAAGPPSPGQHEAGTLEAGTSSSDTRLAIRQGPGGQSPGGQPSAAPQASALGTAARVSGEAGKGGLSNEGR